MGFFDTLRRALSGEHNPHPPAMPPQQPRPSAEPTGGRLSSDANTPGPDVYDRIQWQKKLKRTLDELPGSKADWPHLMTEARALGFDAAWIRGCQIEEFQMLIRQAVSD